MYVFLSDRGEEFGSRMSDTCMLRHGLGVSTTGLSVWGVEVDWSFGDGSWNLLLALVRIEPLIYGRVFCFYLT